MMHSSNSSKFTSPAMTQNLPPPPSQETQEGGCIELDHIIGYSGKYLKSIHFHPKNPNLFIYCIGGLIVLEDINDRHKQDFLRGHDMSVSALAISNSGNLIVSGQEGTIYSKIPESPVILWDLSTLKKKYVFRGLRYGITNLSFSPDEKFIAATAKNNVLMIWSVNDYSVVYNKVLEVPFSLIIWKEIKKNNSKYSSYYLITSVGTNIVINCLEFDVGSMQYQLKSIPIQLPSSGLIRNYTVAFIDTIGENFFVGTTGGEICIFNLVNQVFKAAIQISQNGVLSVVNQNEYIFIGSGDGKLKRLIGKDYKWSQDLEIQLDGRVVSLTLSPNGAELLIGTSLGNIYRVLTSNFDTVLHIEGHIDSINDINFYNGSNESFGTIDSNGLLTMWDLNELTMLTRCILPTNKKMKGLSMSFTDDKGIAGGYEDGFIRCYDISKSRYAPLRWEIANAHRGAVSSLFIDANYILSGGEDGIVRVWSRKHRTLLTQISAHKKTVCKVLPDVEKPELIHSCSQDKTINTFDLKNEKKVMLHQAKNGVLMDMTQRKDHELELITCGVNTPILFWDCDVADPVEKIDVQQKLLTIDVSNSGRFLASGTDAGEIMIFDIQKQSYLGKFIGHSSVVNKLKWSPDEKQIVSVSEDASLCIWNFFS